MALKSWMHLSTSTARLASPVRLAQTREFTVIVSSGAAEKRAFHIDGDGSYIIGSFSVDVKRIRAVKFLCYDERVQLVSKF